MPTHESRPSQQIAPTPTPRVRVVRWFLDAALKWCTGWIRKRRLPPALPPSGLLIAIRLIRRRAGEQFRYGKEHTSWVLEDLATELEELAWAAEVD